MDSTLHDIYRNLVNSEKCIQQSITEKQDKGEGFDFEHGRLFECQGLIGVVLNKIKEVDNEKYRQI